MPVVLSLPSLMIPKYSSTILITSHMPAKKILILLNKVLKRDICIRFALEYESHSSEWLSITCLRFFNWSFLFQPVASLQHQNHGFLLVVPSGNRRRF